MKTRFLKLPALIAIVLFALSSCRKTPKETQPENGGGFEQGHEVAPEADTVAADTMNTNGTQTDPAAN